jgi:BirA family biotin operon repressor/biotin-[acetyl-CoA-carboxylase] ligase
MTDTLSAERLKAHLMQPFRYYDSVASSNDLAMQWLHEGASAGSAVIADEQRAGRGRKGRIWYTPPGVALAVSVILRPAPDCASRVSMLGALSVAELCEELQIEQVGIKWPNDVQINGKKVSGVLPEAAWDNGHLKGVVLGMGVNVRVTFSDDIAQTAINLEEATGRSLDRVRCLAYLLSRVDYWRERIGSDKLFEAWRLRSNTIGQRVRVDDSEGIAQGIDREGALLLKKSDGTMQRILAGDVSLSAPPE